jgi:hypothetical protein
VRCEICSADKSLSARDWRVAHPGEVAAYNARRRADFAANRDTINARRRAAYAKRKRARRGITQLKEAA